MRFEAAQVPSAVADGTWAARPGRPLIAIEPQCMGGALPASAGMQGVAKWMSEAPATPRRYSSPSSVYDKSLFRVRPCSSFPPCFLSERRSRTAKTSPATPRQANMIWVAV